MKYFISSDFIVVLKSSLYFYVLFSLIFIFIFFPSLLELTTIVNETLLYTMVVVFVNDDIVIFIINTLE